MNTHHASEATVLPLFPDQEPQSEDIIDAEVIEPEADEQTTAKEPAPAPKAPRTSKSLDVRRGPKLLSVQRHERTPAEYLETINFQPGTQMPRRISTAAVEAMCDTWPVIRNGQRAPSWAPGRLGRVALTYARDDGIDGHWIIRWAKNFPWLAKVYDEAYQRHFGFAASAKKLAAATFDAFDLMVRSTPAEMEREQEKTNLVLQALHTAAEAGTPFVSAAFDDIVTRGRRRPAPGGKATMGETMSDVMAWAQEMEARKAAGE